MPSAEAGRSGHPQRAAGFGIELGDECLRLVDVAQYADDSLVKTLACLSQLELARRALEQPGAEALLHVADPLADHCRGETHVAPSRRHIPRCCDAGEDLKIRNRGKGHAVALARLKNVSSFVRVGIVFCAAHAVNGVAVLNLTHCPAILDQLLYVRYHFDLQPE
jgi:hypothetical protein